MALSPKGHPLPGMVRGLRPRIDSGVRGQCDSKGPLYSISELVRDEGSKFLLILRDLKKSLLSRLVIGDAIKLLEPVQYPFYEDRQLFMSS